MTNRDNQNALKHGAFTDVVILPGEDPKQLQELRAALHDEWNPEGPTEIDLVESIAMGMWRKRRRKRWLQKTCSRLEMTEGFFQRFHRASWDRLLTVLEDTETGALTEENLASRAYWIAEKHPRNKYDNERAWLDLVASEVMEALDTRVVVEAKTKLVSDEISAGEFVDQDLAFDERINAQMARDVKTLGQIKTMKTIGIGKPRTPVTVQPLKQIEAPSIQAVEGDL